MPMGLAVGVLHGGWAMVKRCSSLALVFAFNACCYRKETFQKPV